MNAYLILEDGSKFQGKAFGSIKEESGEVVFNTSMTGYQEIFTDYSYTGQILVMTYPMIGNYGINKLDVESAKPAISGLIVREYCRKPSNWKNEMDLETYLKQNDIMGIEGIDTRKLVKYLRDKGTMNSLITTDISNYDSIVERLRSEDISKKNYTKDVSTKEVYRLEGNGPRIAVMDFGLKLNILRILKSYDCDITVFPYNTKAEEILKGGFDGVFLSNGPGNPENLLESVENIKKLLNYKPMFGICMGHQLLSMANGAKTYKLKFGHRGGNHPVKDLQTNKVYITSQNHGYAVDEQSIDHKQIIVTHRNLNDGTIEGIKHKFLPIFSVQFHPEASPGPMQSKYLFEQFLSYINCKEKAV